MIDDNNFAADSTIVDFVLVDGDDTSRPNV